MRSINGLNISKLSLIYIATLCSLAISHPLYDLLTKGDHATFFVAHQSKAIDVYIFVVILSVFLPLVLYSFLRVLNFLSKPIGRAFYVVVLTMLFTLLLLLIFRRLEIELGGLNLVIPLVVGLIATLLFISTSWMQTALSFMSVAVIVSPLIFLSNYTIRTFLSTPEAQDYSLTSTARELPNVVMIVFDELPLTSLLDENRLVDEVRYPNFARLAMKSQWFRNTSTTHFSTRSGALPSILTGWYPGTYRENSPEKHTNSNAPIQKQNMPLSIFSLLETTHRIFAVETMSKLAPLNQVLESKGPRLKERLFSLFCDALVIYGHLVVPQGFNSRIPTITGQWRDFCIFSSPRTPSSVEWPYSGGEPASVKRFIESLENRNEPAFYYLHSLLPHFPFQYDAHGELHEAKLNVMSGIFRWVTGENRWRSETIANLAYQAHLIQLRFTDQLLGHVLDRLNEAGLFEQSIIIVTADHGTTFYWDRDNLESAELKRIQASDTMYVPLFIKIPGQEQGVVSDRLVETIDILPTIASVLELEIPWDPDGVSVFTHEEPNRERIAMIPREEKFGKDIDPEYLSLKRKIELFGARNLDGLYRVGPYSEIIGREVSSFSLLQSQEKAKFDRPRYRPDSINKSKVQAYVEGSFTNKLEGFDVKNTKIAIAVNGIIVNTTLSTSVPVSELGKGRRVDGHRQMEEDGNIHFLARIPLNSWSETANEVSVHVIIGDSGSNSVSLLGFSSEP